MPTAGSCFAAAGSALVDLLVPLLPTWNVRYGEPSIPEDVMNGVGEYRAVWLDVDGSSDVELLTVGVGAGAVGLEETASLTVVFQLIAGVDLDPAQEEVDADTAEAVGVLVDLVSATPKPAALLPAGWDTAEWALRSMSRSGGLTLDHRGLGRRIEVTLDVTARRC